MVNVTLTRFVMARPLHYLLHRGEGQTASLRETLTVSHEVQHGVPFAAQTPRSLDMTGSYPNPRLNSLCYCMHINPLCHLAKLTKLEHA